MKEVPHVAAARIGTVRFESSRFDDVRDTRESGENISRGVRAGRAQGPRVTGISAR